MSGTAGTLLRGESDTREWQLSAAYAVAVLALVVAVALLGGGVGRTLSRSVLPVVLLGTPPLVAALSALRGGGLLESIAIGVVPPAAFVLSGRPESLAVGTAGTVATLCLGGALLGFLAGFACRELVALFRAR